MKQAATLQTKKRSIWRVAGLVGIFLILIGSIFITPRLNTHAVASQQQLRRAAAGDLPTYMGSNARTGYNAAETTLNKSNIASLKMHWQYHAGGSVNTQPVVVNGVIYWGSWDGYEHATDLSGKQLWQTFLGTTTGASGCTPPSAGVASTATVATVPIKGTMTQVVFVGGGNSHFYALDATSGTILWNTPLSTSSNTMIWDASAVYGGSVYIGISSYGDCPLEAGQLFQLNASTGTIQHTLNVVPNSCLGGGIWGSPTIDQANNALYVATGNGTNACGYSFSLLKVNTTDLSVISSWQVPAKQIVGDSDFGSTPTLFTATINGTQHQMVGMVNKQGIYYALDRANISAGPLWETRVAPGADNISSSAWDGQALYVGTIQTTLKGQTCAGSVVALNPATGISLWKYCAPGKVQGAITAIPGLVVVGAGRYMVILDAATGKQLFAYHDMTKGTTVFWGAVTVSNGILYVDNANGNLYAFGL